MAILGVEFVVLGFLLYLSILSICVFASIFESSIFSSKSLKSAGIVRKEDKNHR
jgi:hypothetical protein